MIKHSAGEYVNGAFTTNGIENFWSLFKRGIIGIHHQVSHNHLQAYADEFAYRYNTRKVSDQERLATLLTHTQGRLKYKDLTEKKGRKSPLLSSKMEQTAPKYVFRYGMTFVDLCPWIAFLPLRAFFKGRGITTYWILCYLAS